MLIMKKLMMSAAMLALSGSLFAQQEQNLRVMIDNIPEDQAATMVVLYGQGTQFVNDDAASIQIQTVPAGQNRASLTFDGLQAGSYYALLAFQDVNGNGILDRKNGRPTESYVFSESGTFVGTPSFSDVSFRLAQETTAILLDMNVVKVKVRPAAENVSSR